MQLDADAVIWNAPHDERDGRPLLVLMHGRGSNEQDLVALAPALPSEFVVASVRAPIAEFEGWSWFPSDSEPGNPTPEMADDAADAVLAWLDGLGVAPPALGMLGFSQGGAMSVHLLRRAPDRVAFAVNIAGFQVGGTQPGDAALAERRPPVFWGRGDADPYFTPPLVERAEAWLPGHSTLTSRVYPGLEHAISQNELADVVDFLRARLP